MAPRHKSKMAIPTSSPLSRLTRLGFAVYLLSAVVYTANQFFFSPVLSIVFHTSLHDSRSTPSPLVSLDTKADLEAAFERAAALRQDAGDILWGGASVKSADDRSDSISSSIRGPNFGGQPGNYGVDGVEWGVDMMHWHPHFDPLAHGSTSATGEVPLPISKASLPSEMYRKPTPMTEDFFLSKAFGESLQPSKVIPYYYRASNEFEKEDITITTLVTSNRLKIFAALVERYQGPISVTIHVDNIPETRSGLLDSLHALYASSPFMTAFVDVHLIVDRFDRQFNMWRNVAKFFARTDYVMMLDVDFWICTDFRASILGSPEIMSKLREGTAAFVVPAFEFNEQSDGVDPLTFPTNKMALLDLVRDKKIDMFHKSWQPGHGATNYTRYYDTKPGEVYRVHSYTHSYEPYVIYRKEGTPFCDERFIGYGANKAACLYELYLSGISFFILPDDFLIHQSHPYAEKARKHERRYNRKLYTDFREELCFRYLSQFIETDQLQMPRSKNLLIECKKIKGFTSVAGKLIAASQ